MDKNQILDKLKKINYPGFNRDIVSFGMVKDVVIDNNTITIILAISSSNEEKKNQLVKDISEKIKIDNFEIYKDQLKQRLDPTVAIMQGINSYIRKKPKRVVFADGEDENMLKAAIAFKNSKLGTPILVGKEELIKNQIKKIGYNENFDIEIVNSKDTPKREKYVKYLFKKLQREQGMLERDCDRLVRNDRVIWASCMVACKDADAMVTGNTRRYSSSLEKITKVVDPRPGEIMFGLNLVVNLSLIHI